MPAPPHMIRGMIGRANLRPQQVASFGADRQAAVTAHLGANHFSAIAKFHKTEGLSNPIAAMR
ncbi:MAG: hypothetical protein WBF03_04930 [Xanthobacteraceae bacterium]